MGLRGRVSVVVVAAIALLAGCEVGISPTPGAASDAAGTPVTITWLASPITQDQNDPRQILIDAFERAHPTITVQLVSGPASTDALRDLLRTSIPGGAGAPDVYLGDLIWPAAFANEGLALPLSAHLEPSFWNRFAPGVLAGERVGGAIYAAPFHRDQGLLFYRKDLLAAQGLPVPTTWEQLADEALFLVHKQVVSDGFVWEGASYEGLTCVWNEFLADAGGRVLDRTDTHSAMDSPQALRALDFLLQLVTSGVTPTNVEKYNETDVTNQFAQGHAAFARNWNGTYDTLRLSVAPDDVGVAPLPSFAGGPQPGASTQGGWDLYVNPHTGHLAAALEFVRWMTDVQAQEIIARQFNELPSNAHVRGEPDLVASSPVLQAMAHTTALARPSSTPAYPAVSHAIYTNVFAAITHHMTDKAALEAASAQIDAALQ